MSAPATITSRKAHIEFVPRSSSRRAMVARSRRARGLAGIDGACGNHDRIRGTHFETTHENGDKSRVGFTSDEEVGMGKTLFSLTFATALLALASSEASAFVYSSFVCQAVGVRSVGWGRSFFVGEAKMIALSRCARRSGICTISYCVPGY
jgi:hypothetical protein